MSIEMININLNQIEKKLIGRVI